MSDDDSDLDSAGFMLMPPPPPPPPPDPHLPIDMDGLHARPAHMLSVVELCNNSEEDAESVATTAIDTPLHSADEDGNDTGDDGWADHNRCLGMSDDMIPDSEWYCKMCSYRVFGPTSYEKESKEKARVMRETEKLERDARRRKAEQMREEMLAKKSVEAIEHKAKRVLEMQDRILSRKKIKYKDKEEEKLGRLAEDLGKTVRVSKEKLEKLEKEDAALRRKEESLNKKKRGIDEVPREVIEDTSRPDKPTPMPCDFADIPAKYVGKMLAVWDCIYAFRDILELSDITVDQFSRVLTHPMHSPMLTEIHMCLLEKILEDRCGFMGGRRYVSDDEVSIDDSERYRYEIQHAPLTVGVPTRSMLTPLTWPSILCSLISAVPRYTAHATSTFLAAFRALQDTDYPALPVQHKLALLQFLAGRLVGTEKVRNILGKHLNEMIQGTKEYNRAVLQDKKLTLEDEKKLREKQRVELADIVESNKTSMKSWLGKGRDAVSADGMEETKSDFDGDSASDSDLDDLAYSEEALAKNEEELENLQVQEFISRHEYIARKKKLDKQRERLRQKMEVKQRKLQRQEQIERKRAQAKKGITDGLTSKDAALLRSAIEKGKECGLPDRIIVSATHVLEILDAEAVREEEALLKKRKFSALLLQSFVRSEAIGRDRDQLRPADTLKRKYESLVKSGSPRDGLIPEDDDSNATWYCYSSQTEVTSLLEALDARVPREAQLRSALNDHMEKLSSEMPVSKPGLLISDLLNEESAKKRAPRASGSPADQEREFLQWKNNKHSKRKAVQHAEPSVESFREDLLKGQDWISKCLRTLGSTWPDRPENGGAEWRKSVQVIDKIEDFSASLLALETELMAAQTKLKPGSAAAANNASEEPEQNDEKSDEEDDDEEEEVMDALVDDGTMLWPSKYCRERWIQSVKRGKTVAVMATALASLVHRLEVLGFLNVSDEDAMKTRAQSEQEKRSRKERAVNKKKQVEEADDEDGRMVDEWEEDCYICSEGGELVCCDGCPHVFHYSCIGLRRIPRGKIFCHECDTSVNPVFPAKKNGKASSKRPRRSQSPPRGRRRKQAKLDKAKSDDSESESDADSDSAVSATSSARQASSKSSPVRPAHVENHTGPKNPEDQWDVDCSVCGLGGELLCCDGCPRAFHVNCIGLEKIPDTEWFCNECNLQTCGACKKNKIRLDSHVICGSEDGTKGCDRVFHLKCAKLDAVPADDWYCKKCRSKLNL
ncbi:WHIM1 domain [Phytophthora cactorum]|nr:WHIM1 domain [Phytophthora cactorum]